MAIEPNDVARFKNALAKASLEEIRRRLDGSIIFRPWKRGLAEAEVGRRKQESDATEERSQFDAANLRKDISLGAWVFVGFAIVAAVAVIWTVVTR